MENEEWKVANQRVSEWANKEWVKVEGEEMQKTTNAWLSDRDVRRRVKVGYGMGSVRVQALLFVCRGLSHGLGRGQV